MKPHRPSARRPWILSIALFCLITPASQAEPELERISSAMQERRFEDAIAAANQGLAARGEGADHLLYPVIRSWG